jgi:hypothetical protein
MCLGKASGVPNQESAGLPDERPWECRECNGAVDAGLIHQLQHAFGGHGIGQVRLRARFPFLRQQLPSIILIILEVTLRDPAFLYMLPRMVISR